MDDVGVNPDYDYLYDSQATDSSIPVCICCGRTVGHRYWKIRDDAICDLACIAGSNKRFDHVSLIACANKLAETLEGGTQLHSF